MIKTNQVYRLISRRFILCGFVVSIIMLVINWFFPTLDIRWLLPAEVSYFMSFVTLLLISFFNKKGLVYNRQVSEREIWFGNVFADFWVTFPPTLCLSINAKQIAGHSLLFISLLFIGSFVFLILVIRDLRQLHQEGGK